MKAIAVRPMSDGSLILAVQPVLDSFQSAALTPWAAAMAFSLLSSPLVVAISAHRSAYFSIGIIISRVLRAAGVPTVRHLPRRASAAQRRGMGRHRVPQGTQIL